MIGLLPAAGEASRMGGLPKYLLPIPGGFLLRRHIDRMHNAGCKYEMVGFRQQTYLRDNLMSAIAYRAERYDTMSQTVRSVLNRYPFQETGPEVLFGMPDTYIEDQQAYHKLADALNAGTDLAVGLFYTRPEQRSKLGMCRLEGERIMQVIDKPETTDLEWAWGVLGWRPAFWDCIKPEEPHVGYAIPRAIAAGLDVRAVKMEGQYFDCGTPEEYFECIRHITG